ncbi:hypothetical protein AGMMS50256_23550 [Betaproteobacteria bacterium]|nr:hypothetical protein AGMMS50256_23550 [Betaproteobacteria bacterium]
MKPLLELRVLSGPALGAAIELGAGRYVVGADDGCDVVLAADTSVAGRHLTLEIHAQPNAADGIRVEARPVDGERVALNGIALPEEGATLAKGEAVGLGFTALAWRPCGEPWGPITLVPLEFARLAPGTAAVSETVAVSAPPETAGEPSAADLAPDLASGATGAGNDETRVPAPAPASALSRWGGASLILLALLFVLALVYTKTDHSRDAAAQALADELERAGIHTVTVLEAEDSKALLLRGEVADDEALDALTRIASAQPLRTYLEVRVGQDLLRALQETLNAHDFYPEFSYADGGRLHFALYLKDGLTESRLLELGRDIPRLAQASRKVVYAQDVAPVLARELRALGLDDARVNYLAGKVRLPYRLTPEAGQQLALALARVRQSLGVPIAFQMHGAAADSVAAGAVGAVGATTENEQRPDFAPVHAAEAQAEVTANDAKNGLGGLDVMSVTLGAMPFVTMSDRQKLFSGAVLPGGFVLVGIHTDRLVLQKDQETFIHSLKETP